MNQAPKVFMSYSHDSDEHINWVLHLSKQLRSSGIDVILDQLDLELGGDIAVFMESNITESDKVLMICTDKYNEKADAGTGGVGYEKTIVTRELIVNSQSDRFIPIVRQHSFGLHKIPKFLGSRRYLDLSEELKFQNGFRELVRCIHGTPHPDKNPVAQYSRSGLGDSFISNMIRIPRTGQPYLTFNGFIKGHPCTTWDMWKYTIYQSESGKYVLHIDRHKSRVYHSSPPDEAITFQDIDSIQSYILDNIEHDVAIIMLNHIGVVKDEIFN